MASNGINLQEFSEINSNNRTAALDHAKRLADGVIVYGNSDQKALGEQLYAIANKLGATPGIGSKSATAFASTDKEIKNTLSPPMQANAGSIYNPFSVEYSPPPPQIRAQVSDTMHSNPIKPKPASDMAAQTAKKIQDEAQGAAFQARLQQTKAGIAARIEVTRQEALEKENNKERLIKAKEAVKKKISDAVRYYQIDARKNVLAAQTAAKKDGATDAELLDFLQKYEEYENNIKTADLELTKSLDKASTSSKSAADKSAYSTNLLQIENLLKTTNPNIPTLRNSVTALKTKYNIPELNNKADILLTHINKIAKAEADKDKAEAVKVKANIDALNRDPLYIPTTNAGRKEQERRTQQREASAATGNATNPPPREGRMQIGGDLPTTRILEPATRNYRHYNLTAAEKNAANRTAALANPLRVTNSHLGGGARQTRRLNPKKQRATRKG